MTLVQGMTGAVLAGVIGACLGGSLGMLLGVVAAFAYYQMVKRR